MTLNMFFRGWGITPESGDAKPIFPRAGITLERYGARQLSTYWVGQGVGLMNEIQTTRQVVYDFMEDFLEATDRLRSVMDDD